jgi:hypothetical protein
MLGGVLFVGGELASRCGVFARLEAVAAPRAVDEPDFVLEVERVADREWRVATHLTRR